MTNSKSLNYFIGFASTFIIGLLYHFFIFEQFIMPINNKSFIIIVSIISIFILASVITFINIVVIVDRNDFESNDKRDGLFIILASGLFLTLLVCFHTYQILNLEEIIINTDNFRAIMY